MEREREIEEEEEKRPIVGETASFNAAVQSTTPLLPTGPPKTRSVRTKVPEIEVHLYRQGQGPVNVFKSALGGWDQDQLEVRDILDKHNLKSLYSFSLDTGRSSRIRFHPRNGRSLMPYTAGSVIYVDGEVKASLIKPITKILVGIAIVSIMLVLVLKAYPELIEKLDFSGGRIPPWILACMVILFTHLRKRTKDFLKSRGW
ncbi:uncharacterized protein LOC124945370 [Impatiens glandulifera]|uniref:uncharacterized protein LOC124945370 n=1 Tax=Impatiens glandulifera TaxID=253017 RepID=UPI001FB18E42|nr:uncharacterized protein LOC124945370 [Impatiens glandulifera]